MNYKEFDQARNDVVEQYNKGKITNVVFNQEMTRLQQQYMHDNKEELDKKAQKHKEKKEKEKKESSSSDDKPINDTALSTEEQQTIQQSTQNSNGDKSNNKTAHGSDETMKNGVAPTDHPGRSDTLGMLSTSSVSMRDFNSIIGNSQAWMARQHLLNPKNYKTEFKTPNPGKMPNNLDAYPVDLKIEELEVHEPPVKINKVITHVDGKAATVAAMSVGDHAEKRIVKLENLMATFMRYLFRLGARVPINCVYYGGQTA